MTQLHHQHSRTSPEINQKQNGQMTCESRCSWELHCRFQSSKFTIPNDGYIARAAGILTGRTSFLFSIRIFSAAGVVGPLAPSAMIWQEVQTKEFNKNLNQKKGISASFFFFLTLALILWAFLLVICFSLAAGTKMSHSASSKFSSAVYKINTTDE